MNSKKVKALRKSLRVNEAFAKLPKLGYEQTNPRTKSMKVDVQVVNYETHTRVLAKNCQRHVYQTMKRTG